MIVAPGATSISVDIQFLDDTGAAVTGKVAADFPACRWSGGSNTADTTITLSDLAAITTAHPNDNTAGGVKEREGGWYRLDLPNNMVSAAGRKTLTFAETTNKRILAPFVDVQTVASDAKAINGVSTSLVTTIGANVGTTQPVIFTGTGASALVSSSLAAILGTALTETAGFLAAGFKKFFNIATPASTMDALTLVATATTVTNRVTANTDQLAGQTVTAAAGVTFPTSVASPTNITAASGISLAPTDPVTTNLRRMLGRTSGTIWFVATTGNDSTGDGLSFATAYLTPTKAASVTSAGDAILVGPGTFALGNAVVNIPDNVNLFGMGKYRTTITSTANLNVLGCIVRPGNNSTIAHLAITGVGSGVFQAPFGFHTGASTPQGSTSNWVLDDCLLSGDSDGVYFNNISETPTQVRGILRACLIRTLFDCVRCLSNFAWDFVLDLYGCNVQALGPSVVGLGHTSRAVAADIGTVRIFDGYYSASGSSITNTCIEIEDNGGDTGAVVEAYDAVLVSAGTNHLDLDNRASLSNSALIQIVGGAIYDPTKTLGTITVRSIQASPVTLAASQHVIADSLVGYVAPDNANIGVAAAQATTAATQATTAATQSTTAATNTGTIINRLGAWTGSGNNTMLGGMRALANKLAGLTPTDLTSGGGTFDNTEDSLEAAHDSGAVVTVGGYATGQDPATLVLDPAATSHNLAGSIGAKINSAGASGDPLANDVPGAYAPGTAGYKIGHSADTVEIIQRNEVIEQT